MINKQISSSYNNVIDALKCVAITHGMVNNVSSGDADEIDIAANNVYPLVHIVPQSVVANVKAITYNFNVLVMDLVKHDDRNEQQVLSDTLQIILDIISQYKHGLMLGVQQNDSIYSQSDDKDFSVEPFTERFDNVVSGWNCSFNLQVPYNYYACDSFNVSANLGETGWIFTDNGQVNCKSFANTPKENNPSVLPASQTT
tara:strand:- start:89 stop:688 length:600 start_codon:yes stop_codon:yes gene_type:complete